VIAIRLGARTAAVLALIFGALALPTGAAALPRTGLKFLHVGSWGGPAGVHQITDGRGRQVLLRGVNVDGLVDYWRSDLRVS